jgi:hypothetical protein
VADADIILAFWSGTTCHTLVHELSHDQSSTTKELLDLTIWHASGEEVIGAAFVLGNAKAASSGSQVAWSKATDKSARKGANGSNKGQKQCPDALQSLPAMMTMARKLMTPTRSMSRSPSVTSSARRGS